MSFLIPFLIAVALGVVGIDRQAWRDEHSTWSAATIAVPDLRSLLSHTDIVLAPYYVFMRGWIFVFGDSVIAMRVPSLLAMATAAGLTAVLGERLFTPWVGITAGCLFAVIPSVSRYAEEARPYAFAICFAVASVLAVVARRWVLVGVFVALTGLAHLIALTVVVAHVPLLRDPDPLSGAESGRPRGLWDLDHAVWRRWAFAVALGMAPLVPLALIGARQTGQVDWIHATWKQLATLLMSLTRSAVVAGILAALAVLAAFAALLPPRSAERLPAGERPRGPGVTGPPTAAAAALASGVAFPSAASTAAPAGAAVAVRPVVALLAWAAVPAVLIFVAAPQFFYYRYLLFTLPAWTLLAAFGAAQALSRKGALATVGLCATVLALGAHDQVSVRKSPLPGDQDYQGAASYVAQRLEPGDTAYYDGFEDQREERGFAYELRRGVAPTPCPSLAACPGRVWLVSNRVVVPPSYFTVLDTQRFAGLEVQLLRRA